MTHLHRPAQRRTVSMTGDLKTPDPKTLANPNVLTVSTTMEMAWSMKTTPTVTQTTPTLTKLRDDLWLVLVVNVLDANVVQSLDAHHPPLRLSTTAQTV